VSDDEQKVFLPKTKLQIVEKYLADETDERPGEPPGGSFRLVHPDIGDVLQTDYAKGVISDFKVKSEDPFAVVSRVKVKLIDEEGNEGEESDYIPIFYHPKKGLWDDRGFRDASGNLKDGEKDYTYATDLKKEPGEGDEPEDYGYFEKAWMSFRCGDEVIVMLKPESKDNPELKPCAVVAFADGVKRPGENVFKMTGLRYPDYPGNIREDRYFYAFNSIQRNYYYDGTPYNTYPAGAAVDPEKYYVSGIIKPILDDSFDKEKNCVTPKFKTDYHYLRTIVDHAERWELIGRYIYDNWVIAVFRFGSVIERQYNLDMYWAVGPVMFCQTIMKTYTLADGYYQLAIQHGSEWDPADFLRVMNPPVWPEWADDPSNLGFKPENITPCAWQGETPIPTHPEMDPFTWEDWPTEEDEEWFDIMMWSWPDSVEGIGGTAVWAQPFYCAVYTPELWENPNTDKMICQAGDLINWTNDFYQLSLQPRWIYSNYTKNWRPESIEIFVPPHTKEELVEAGMWPKES
jgi:hypothetical protein